MTDSSRFDRVAAPLLSRGKHQAPTDGMCLMEMASLMAREPFSDHPRAVHPTLAEVARQVNDRVSNDKRDELLSLLPVLMYRRCGDGPKTSARVVLTCLQYAQQVMATRRGARYVRRTVRYLSRLNRVERPFAGRARDAYFRAGLGAHAIAASMSVVQHCGDDALLDMLGTAVRSECAVTAPRAAASAGIEVAT